MSELRVESLHTYPIKSCAGTELQSAEVTERGLEADRYFMIVDEQGNFISQRKHPRLALVNPEIYLWTPDYIELTVNAPDMDPLNITHETASRNIVDFIETRVHCNPVGALRTTDEADEWFSEYLGFQAYLCATDHRSHRMINFRYWHDETSNETGFADAFPVLLASQASLDEFNARMAGETGGEPIGMERFRPNIVVAGDDLEAYAEDYWRRMRIGSMIAHVVRPCKRCAIPYVDQETGEPTGNKTVGTTLARTRKGWDTTKPEDNGSGVYFGQNLLHVYEQGLVISQGNEVTVQTLSREPNVALRQAA